MISSLLGAGLNPDIIQHLTEIMPGPSGLALIGALIFLIHHGHSLRRILHKDIREEHDPDAA